MKVLIVDDENLVRLSLQRAFEKAGHEVQLAEDGRQGIELWRSWQPDCVVLDVLMPEHSGPEVIQEVQPSEKVAIILISAFSGEYQADSVKQLGADLFIAKPFEDIKDVVVQAQALYQGKSS
ncbi:MAG: response regulator [Bdellovibrionales bacterium]|nr:response regulator [Bdellovibrionales bacterium]